MGIMVRLAGIESAAEGFLLGFLAKKDGKGLKKGGFRHSAYIAVLRVKRFQFTRPYGRDQRRHQRQGRQGEPPF